MTPALLQEKLDTAADADLKAEIARIIDALRQDLAALVNNPTFPVRLIIPKAAFNAAVPCQSDGESVAQDAGNYFRVAVRFNDLLPGLSEGAFASGAGKNRETATAAFIAKIETLSAQVGELNSVIERLPVR